MAYNIVQVYTTQKMPSKTQKGTLACYTVSNLIIFNKQNEIYSYGFCDGIKIKQPFADWTLPKTSLQAGLKGCILNNLMSALIGHLNQLSHYLNDINRLYWSSFLKCSIILMTFIGYTPWGFFLRRSMNINHYISDKLNASVQIKLYFTLMWLIVEWL